MTTTKCAAHPGTTLVHRDEKCECFSGGPAPEYEAPAWHWAFTEPGNISVFVAA